MHKYHINALDTIVGACRAGHTRHCLGYFESCVLEGCHDMAKFYVICNVILCHNMTICHDMRFIYEVLIYHCMRRVSDSLP